ncbi:MAG: DUF4245 domain-containing protein [Actinobacteria bacterium]|nr:DUF4245 domain-containing protein [Actinomycetota bacterium]NBY15295.1 DUF4245 domain-containing protein [Actinomycetota bacterium]
MAKKRGRETARDMVFSMGAVLLTVLVILTITFRKHDQTLPEANFTSALSAAQAQSNWPVFIPSVEILNSPTKFKLTQARYEAESYGNSTDTRWYLGYRTAENRYISLWQSDGQIEQIVATASNEGQCIGSVQIAGKLWQKCSQAKPLSRVIFRKDGDTVLVVSGTESFPNLINFAAGLRKS